MKIGDTVRFVGCEYAGNDELNCDDPNVLLLKGNTYLIERSETLVDGYSYLDRIELISKRYGLLSYVLLILFIIVFNVSTNVEHSGSFLSWMAPN